MHIQIYHNFLAGTRECRSYFSGQMDQDAKTDFINKVWDVVEKALYGVIITFSLCLVSNLFGALGTVLPWSIALIGTGMTLVYPALPTEKQESIQGAFVRVKDAIDILSLGREEFIRRRASAADEL